MEILFYVLFFALLVLCILLELKWVRFSLRATSKIQFGIVLEFETCGCKHLDIGFGLFYLRYDFGTCIEKPSAPITTTTENNG